MNNKIYDPDWALNNAYWYVILSTGETFLGEGIEPALEGESRWEILKSFLIENKLRIHSFVLKFRSHEVQIDVPTDVNVVYFSKGHGKEWVTDQEDRFFIVGIQKTDTMMDQYWYKVPELVEHKVVAREISKLQPEFLHSYGQTTKQNECLPV